ncbi:LOW QUALITY PROTEIN: hypothetical protein CVT25_013887 [Psilocybe cyanescens]|uniref:Uncharacterized protein n=1 Tax=Psilocybe cyanescens TaxID=93625 RepID=A0A409XZ95_PSICY|nr:LOW QUALITY PROTEIN: hypothetical protein CVT25_013887 [Psilocybe cyanescens]
MPETSHPFYSLLSDKDEVPSSEQLLPRSMSPRSSRSCSRTAFFWTTALNIVFLTSGILFFLEAPASGVISYYSQLFNLSSEEAMQYQGHPTAEITAAWDSITDDVRPMRIPMEMLPLVNTKDDGTLVKFSEEDGGGVMASIGVLHQLHCVVVPAEELRGHLGMLSNFQSQDTSSRLTPSFYHCVELLRQTISCAGDVTVLTYRWHGDKPHPNFDKIHQCRRFDDILDWALEHAVHIPASHILRNTTAIGSH